MGRCIACGKQFDEGESRQDTDLGDLCMTDAVPTFMVRVNGEAHWVNGWTQDLVDRINATEKARVETSAAAHFDCPGFDPQSTYWNCYTHELYQIPG